MQANRTSRTPLFTEDLIDFSELRIIQELARDATFESRSSRSASYSDESFFVNGIRRVLMRFASGRDFLQFLSDEGQRLPRASYFDALASSRRSRFASDAAKSAKRHSQAAVARAGIDYLANFPELAEYDVLAVDGHSIEHACHDAKGKRGSSTCVTALYSLDLRCGLAEPLVVTSSNGQLRHEMPPFREWIQNTERSRSTIFVGDPAYVNHEFWWRRASSLCNTSTIREFIVTRAKSDMAPNVCGELEFDHDDPVNRGVQSVRRAGFGTSPSVFYLVDYEDPETKTSYTYLTTVDLASGIRPGAVVELYRVRWNVEKVFDNFKNNFIERKAWASGQNAAIIQSSFIASTYNLLRLIAALLEERGIVDQKVRTKRQKWLSQREKDAAENGCQVHPLQHEANRMSRLSSQFIRTIRNHLHSSATLLGLLGVFRRALAVYL